ncbi:hypothetical protein Poli38472_012643 [Pythium oligandrum]|uniref:NmrA-like domain-containing protein n=1 Tax=Pythium oligandrum TaxID=41045 RepID=A0A8K1CFY9_PYTOL|nr:hypothetical protein Poli38472_012643 [Pythium oligandrum]|eukprot:TMW61452.1 hypothetical protein Poli38472_012643 [Pythium oligandrum]
MPASTATVPLLVTGASGQLGKLVINHLLNTLQIRPERIVAGTRDPTKLQELADKGVQVLKIDFKDIQTVTAAAAGVERALLISVDDLIGGDDVQNAAVDALAKAGVNHIVYTSLQALDKTLFSLKNKHLSTEVAIKSSKVGYSILRNGLYFENNIGSIAGALKSGQWYSAAKDGKVSLISRDDLARAAAYALASDNTENVVYELTGPEALTVDEIAAQVSETVEKPIEVIQVSVEDLSKGIAAATGLPAALADVLATLDEATAGGVAGDVTDAFEKLTGVKAQTHREWLSVNKAFLQSL